MISASRASSTKETVFHSTTEEHVLQKSRCEVRERAACRLSSLRCTRGLCDSVAAAQLAEVGPLCLASWADTLLGLTRKEVAKGHPP